MATLHITSITACIKKAFAFMSFFGWRFTRSITRPLGNICTSVTAIADGDSKTDVVQAIRGDEIGMIGKTLVSMRADLGKGRANETARAEQQREQMRVVDVLSEGWLRLSKGDFSQEIQEEFSGEHDTLRVNYNTTVSTLNDTVAKVVQISSNIRSASAEINKGSQNLSHRTESQAATLEETAAALDEMTASVRSAAENARSVETTMTEACKSAETNHEVVENAVSAMTQLDQVTQQNTALVQETTSTSDGLNSDAMQLAEQVSHFHLGQGGSARVYGALAA